MLGLWIATGGAVGAVARFLLGGWVTTWAHGGFPWATFAVNAGGSLLLGFLQGALPPVTTTPRVRGMLTIGLCGGFTTFSTFDYEMLALLQHGRHAVAGTYAAASVVTCVAAIFAGLTFARGLRVARSGSA